jgi:hypothetical protein
MNILNRIVVVVLLILALLLVSVTALIPDTVIERLVEVAGWADRLVGRMERPIDNLLLIGVGAVIDFGLLLLLVLELRRPGAKAVRVQRVEEGAAMLTVDSIKRRLSYYIDGLEDVISVKPQVQVQRNKVRVAVDVQTAATTNVPAKAQEVVSTIRMVVVETLGLELRGQPEVNIKTRSYKDIPVQPAPSLEAEREGESAVEEVALPVETVPEMKEDLLPAMPELASELVQDVAISLSEPVLEEE